MNEESLREDVHRDLHDMKVAAITASVVGLVLVIVFVVLAAKAVLSIVVPVVAIVLVLLACGYLWFKVRREIRRHEGNRRQ